MSVYRKFRVARKIRESDLVVSLYLEADDGLSLPPYRPGQHLQFRLNIPGQEIPLYRNYSFSDVYDPSCYRISVKKELAPRNPPGLPAGAGSSYLFDTVQAGDRLEAKGPQGDFYLDPAGSDPVVFFAGGIGITPLLSMVKSIAVVNPRRRVYFIYGINERKDHSFREELEQLRKRHPGFQFLIFYTLVGPGDAAGVDFDYKGFIDMELVLKAAGDLDMEHYICGPGVMMDAIRAALLRLGVPERKMHIEAFSMSAVEQSGSADDADVKDPVEKPGGLLQVSFLRSGKRIEWDPRYPSLLAFAEAHDIEIASGCLFGDCGTCLTTLREGQIKYMHPTMVKPAAGSCLPCSCIPVSDLILEA
jgi:ferredoxin-NADP reductase